MDKENIARKIKDEIRKRFKDADKNIIVLNMKSGNQVKIIRQHKSAHYSHGGYVEGKCWYEIRQSISVDPFEKRYFKTIYGIAKAMAYGYIK